MFLLRLSFYLSVAGFFFPVSGRRYSHDFGKYTGKISLFFKTKSHGNFIQFHIRHFDILAGFLYFQAREVMDGRGSCLFLEQGRKVGLRIFEVFSQIL